MKEALIVAIIFGSLVLIPAVIGGTIVISIKLLKGGAPQGSGGRFQNYPGNISGSFAHGGKSGSTGNYSAGSRKRGS